jgi:hypothetical protein
LEVNTENRANADNILIAEGVKIMNNISKTLITKSNILIASLAVLFYAMPANANVTPNLSNSNEANLIVTCTGSNACSDNNGTITDLQKNNSAYNTSIMNSLASLLGFTYNPSALENYQFWTVNSGQSVKAEALFAGNSENIGWVNRNTTSISASNFNSLFQIYGSAYTVTGSSTAINPNPSGGQFQFVLNSPSASGNYFSSQIAANSDGYQHVIAIAITPTQGSSIPENSYILAFEDTAANNGSDLDYNDAVVLVSGVTPVGLGVPEPATYLMLGSALTMAFFLRRRPLKNTIRG